MAGAQVAWGLDVGITSLKAMKLRKDGDKVALEAFDVVEHDTFLSEPDVDKDEIIRGTLRKFLDRNPIRGEAVFIGVPGSSTFARFVKLPPVDPKKIPEIVRFEAIQQIPFPLDQVNWDYHTFTNPDSPDVEVGIFAMKKELVGQVLSNFRTLGLTVHGVQMSPLAVYNAAAYDGITDGKGTVVIDMGAEHTDLVIMDQGRLWLRTINIGGNHFTDALAKSFKQPFNRAEQLKKTAATSKYQKQIFQAMRPIFADLVAEIQRSIGHYNSSHRDSRLERIIGMGNPFKLPNLQKYLQQELKMEVIRLDNFRKVNVDGRLAAGLTENILPMTASYGLAVQALGMAPIDTNLLPLEIARQMLWKRKRIWFYAATAAVVAGSLAWAYQYWTTAGAVDAPGVQAQRDQNNTKVADAVRRSGEWTSKSNTFDRDKQRVDQFMKLGDKRDFWPLLTLDLYGALPQAAQTPVKTNGRVPTSAPAPAGPAIVVMSIDSDYTTSLSTAGGFSRDAAPGSVPGPGLPMAMPGAMASSSGDERGFLINMVGYTSGPTSPPGYDVVNEYVKRLTDRAPKKGPKPYYIEAEVPRGDPNTTGPWGPVTGVYKDEFIEDIVGARQEVRPTAPGYTAMARPTVETAGLNLFAKPPGPGKPPLMTPDNFRFILTLKVHLKETK